MQKAELVIRP